MKKLFVLILVLALMPAANAAFIQVGGQTGDTFNVLQNTTITIVSEDTKSWLGYIIVQTGGVGTLSNATALSAAGNMGTVSPYSEAGWGTGYQVTVAQSPGGSPAIAVGPQFSMNFAGTVGQSARISLFADPEFTVPIASVLITIVPEPMTLLLLGFGSLLLRRRK